MLKLGEEQSVKALGRDWTLGRLEVRVIRAFRDWIAKQIGDPFKSLEKLLPYLDKEEGLKRIKAAEEVQQQLEGFSLGCALAQRFVKVDEGACFIVCELLKAKHPDVTEEEAFQVVQAIGEQEMHGKLANAQGKLPNSEAPADGQAAPLAA